MPIGKQSIKRASVAASSDKKAASAATVSEPTVTEHVIGNISPEILDKIIEKPEENQSNNDRNHPKDGKVQILSAMPDYLL